MDTEGFLLRRRALVERLEERRAKDLASYPSPLGGLIGLRLPTLARLALSLAPRGLVSSLVQIGLPLAATFFLKKKTPVLGRLLGHFFPSKL